MPLSQSEMLEPVDSLSMTDTKVNMVLIYSGMEFSPDVSPPDIYYLSDLILFRMLAHTMQFPAHRSIEHPCGFKGFKFTRLGNLPRFIEDFLLFLFR
jgi:hypothetical protein